MSERGVTFASGTDAPPFVAIGFRAKKAGSGKYRYVWLYRVKFKVPSESYETKSKGFTYKTPELEGEFVRREKDDEWKADYTGLPADEDAKGWFDKVIEPTGDEKPAPDPGLAGTTQGGGDGE